MRRLLLALLTLTTASLASAGAPPTRVVTLAPYLAELVCAAGGCGALVGVSAYSDYPPPVTQLPQIGDAFALNLEAILALRPDLILAWQGGTPPERVARLRQLGLRVEWLQADRLDAVATALEQTGAWLGTAADAKRAADAYRVRLAALRAQHLHDTAIRTVYQIETAPTYTINHESVISEAIALCGGVNVFADLPHIAASISAEAMLAAAPEAVIYGGEENETAIRAYWQRLGAAPAARRNALYAVNADLLGRATPRLLDGVVAVCQVLDRARAARANDHR